MNHKSFLSRLLSVFAVCGPLISAGTACGQNASATSRSSDTSGDASLQEIVVTAERRAENLQNVPIGVTVVQGADLENSNLRTLADIQYLVPSLQYNPSNGGGFQIRGVGTQSFDYSIEQSVSTVVDDVVMDAPRDAGLSGLNDTNRVEVLRGPQGTLFGKNSTSGVVSITTNNPVLGETSAIINASYGQRNDFNVNTIVNMPINDTMAFRMTAFGQGQDGYGENVVVNRKVDAYVEEGARAKLLLKANDNLEFLFKADFSHHYDNLVPAFVSSPPGTAAILAANGVAVGPNNHSVTDPNFTYLNTESFGGSLDVNYRFWGQTLTSVTAYRRTDYDGNAPLDYEPGVPYAAVNVGVISTHKFSQEIRLASGTGGFYEYVAGLFFNRLALFSTQDQWGTFGAPLPPGVLLSTVGAAGTTSDQDRFDTVNQSEAVFGQVRLNFTDQWRLALGARFTHDHNSQALSFGSIPYTSVIVPLFPAPTPENGTVTASKGSFTINPQYQITKDVMLYLTYATGYKGPGVAFVDSVFSPYGAETAKSYEAGLKSELLDHRVRFNADVFYEKYNDFQAQIQKPNIAIPTVVIGNAGGLKSEGVEIDSNFAVTRNLSLSAGLTFDESIFTNYIDGPNNYTGQSLTTAPRWSSVLGANYTGQLFGDYKWNANLNDSYRSVQYSLIGDPNSLIHAYGLVGGRLSVGQESGRWSAGVYARNLLDKHFDNSFVTLSGIGYLGYSSGLAFRTIGGFVSGTF